MSVSYTHLPCCFRFCQSDLQAGIIKAVLQWQRRESFKGCPVSYTHLPGTMIGQILGGSSPNVAIKYQMMIMVITFTASMLDVYKRQIWLCPFIKDAAHVEFSYRKER